MVLSENLKKILKEKNWIQGAIKHPGSLTKAAKKEGISNSEYEKEHKNDSGKAGKRARLALTIKKMKKESYIPLLDSVIIKEPVKFKSLFEEIMKKKATEYVTEFKNMMQKGKK